MKLTQAGFEVAYSANRADALKAGLHLQFSLRFLVRFSSSDGWERVDKL
jgi:hypothetical protein